MIKTIITIHMNQRQANPGRGESREAQVQNPLSLTKHHFPDQKKQHLEKKKRKCVFCNINYIRREVIYKCRDCDKALCVVPCFKIYHTVKDFILNQPQD